MALTRKDKPDWFALTDRVKAIFELEIATQAELARFLKVPDQRIREWIQHVREPKAQIVLSIQKWASEEVTIPMGDELRFKTTIRAISRANQ